MNKRAVILAAGRGTRMHSNRCKVLTPLIDRPVLAYVIEELQQAGVEEIVIVIGHQASRIIANFGGMKGISFAYQREQLGTGHALMQAQSIQNLDGETLVISGDSPLITSKTIRDLFELAKGKDMVVLSALVESPGSYGRIIRDKEGQFEQITEAKDCTPEQYAVKEINSGIYCFKNKLLFDALSKISNENAQREYYLTDVASILKKEGKVIEAFIVEDNEEILGINTCLDLEKAFSILQKRINTYWLEKGVQMERMDQIVIGKDVTIGQDVLIQAGTRITGQSRIEDEAEIHFGSLIHNAVISKGAVIETSTVKNCTIPPRAHIQGLREES